MNGDGAAMELGQSVGVNSGGESAGLDIWNEKLVLNGTRNNFYGSDVLTVLSNDHLWHGPTSLATTAAPDAMASSSAEPVTRLSAAGAATRSAW